VGMTRGRHENRACVVTEAAGTGHGHRPPPGPVDVLTDVLRRSSAEVSATEALRTELDRSDQPAMLRRLLEQARAHIDAGAGPDRRPELRRLQRLRSDLPILRNMVAANERDVARVTRRSPAPDRASPMPRPASTNSPDPAGSAGPTSTPSTRPATASNPSSGTWGASRANEPARPASSTGAADASPMRSGPSPASPRSKPPSPAAATGSSAIRPNSPGSPTSPAASPGPPKNPTRRCPDRIPPSPTTTSRRSSGPST
jgi:hypothetical protein